MSQAQSPAAPEVSATELRVTFVGNAGFLIECGGKKILIDALYRAGVPGYDILSSELQNRIETAQAPFDGVDLVLATHVHNDHFEPIAVGRYLVSNPLASFVTTSQTVQRLQDEFRGFSAVSSRVRGIYPPEGDKIEVPVEGLKLTVMTLHHGRNIPFQNLGFLVEVDGVKILHLGDTQASHAEIGRYSLPAEKIDVAFVPFWFLLDAAGLRMVREAIAPKTVIPMHIPVARAPSVLFGNGVDRASTLQVLKTIPDIIVFEKPLEERVISLGGD